MRVARRTRPTQVGFAASIGRRRLLQTFDSHSATTPHHPIATDSLRMVIRLDFSSPDSALAAEAEGVRFQPALAGSSSDRGR